MFVSPINNAQPSFNGYVDRFFKDSMNVYAENDVKNFVNRANEKCRRIEPGMLQAIDSRKAALLKRFNNFMEGLHPNTRLCVGWNNSFLLENTLTHTYLNIKNCDKGFNYFSASSYDPIININYSDGDKQLTLDSMAKLINGLERLIPRRKEMDSVMYEQYKSKVLETAEQTSLISRIRTYFNKINADKIGLSFNQPSLKPDIELAQKSREAKLENQKQNNRLLKNFLRGK